MYEKNENRIYVFTTPEKGNSGYLIADSKFKTIHIDKIKNVTKNHPYARDYEAQIEGLEYIKRRNNKITDDPRIFIYTTYENHFRIANNNNKPISEDVKDYKYRLDRLVESLERDSSHQKDKVRFFYIARNFDCENLKIFIEKIENEQKRINT